MAEDFLPEDDVLHEARRHSHEVGIVPVAPSVGATLAFLATVVNARAIVEVGTGTGVSGLYLLRGIRTDGVLTTIDAEPEHQSLARRAFADAGHPASRCRLIPGRGLDVLPRLADHAYDLAHFDGPSRELGEYLGEAQRLLRPGGVVVISGAMRGRVSDPYARDPDTLAMRALHAAIREDPRLTPVLLPAGNGLLAVAVGESHEEG
jgi:predicted O-methyltransferase YrrM